MSTMNISLPEQMRSYVEMQVNGGLYSSASDYIRALIREDQKRRSQTELEVKLLEAIESGKFDEATPAFFDNLRERAKTIAAEGKESGSA